MTNRERAERFFSTITTSVPLPFPLVPSVAILDSLAAEFDTVEREAAARMRARRPTLYTDVIPARVHQWQYAQGYDEGVRATMVALGLDAPEGKEMNP